MRFRVVVAGEGAMLEIDRDEPLKVGDTFTSTSGIDLLRVRSISFDPVGEHSPEMLIGAERIG